MPDDRRRIDYPFSIGPSIGHLPTFALSVSVTISCRPLFYFRSLVFAQLLHSEHLRYPRSWSFLQLAGHLTGAFAHPTEHPAVDAAGQPRDRSPLFPLERNGAEYSQPGNKQQQRGHGICYYVKRLGVQPAKAAADEHDAQRNG